MTVMSHSTPTMTPHLAYVMLEQLRDAMRLGGFKVSGIIAREDKDAGRAVATFRDEVTSTCSDAWVEKSKSALSILRTMAILAAPNINIEWVDATRTAFYVEANA